VADRVASIGWAILEAVVAGLASSLVRPAFMTVGVQEVHDLFVRDLCARFMQLPKCRTLW
jgi:hypothetical protein